MKTTTKLQAAWLYAAFFAECQRCEKGEELIFTRAFLQRVGGINRWQDKNQKALQELVNDGKIIAVKRAKEWRSQDFYRLSDEAREELQRMFTAVKIHAWIAGCQPQLSNISASGEFTS